MWASVKDLGESQIQSRLGGWHRRARGSPVPSCTLTYSDFINRILEPAFAMPKKSGSADKKQGDKKSSGADSSDKAKVLMHPEISRLQSENVLALMTAG